MELKELLNKIEHHYPQGLQEEWDCSGLLYYSNRKISKVLICLDITPRIARYAINNDVDLIISHHPLIFASYPHSLAYIRDTFQRLYAHDIGMYSMHTNYDNHPLGMNARFIEQLGYPIKHLNDGMLKTFQADTNIIDKIVAQAHNIRIYNMNPTISKVGVLLGGGGSNVNEALALGCDTYISSEFKHHDIMYAKEFGLMLIDVTHQMELLFCDDIAHHISENTSLIVEVIKEKYDVNVIED